MPQRMTREEFYRWAEAQPKGRFERVDGVVVAMAPERITHARVKARVWQSLDRAIRRAGLPCEALPDGVTVEVDDGTDYETDAVVNCGDTLIGDSVAAANPVVVVEVLSPTTRSVDAGEKFAGYFRVPAVQHYLIVQTRRRGVIHHKRVGDRVESQILTVGEIVLGPPGITVSVEEFYADLAL
jgi:Uma2 family endonuclease